MNVTLASDWGGSTVAGLVADALAVSQAMAAHRNAHEIDLADLAAGLLSAPDGPVSRVLEALHVDRERLVSDLASPTETRVASEPPEAGADVLAIIARAPIWRGDSDDEAVGLRLLGEVAETSAVRLQALRDAKICTDRLRWAAARCGIAYDAPTAHAEPLRLPTTPTLAELRERTPGPRSAAVASVMRKVLPEHQSPGTPYGLVRVRRWGLAHVIFLCVRPLTILVMIAFGIRTHSWWSVSAILLLFSPEFVPLILSITSYASLTVIVSLKFPWPFLMLVLVTAAADGVGFWYQLWMKRIDEGDPSLPVAAIRRAALQQVDHLLASWRLERARGG
jgi:hypothetical protein